MAPAIVSSLGNMPSNSGDPTIFARARRLVSPSNLRLVSDATLLRLNGFPLVFRQIRRGSQIKRTGR